MHDHDLNESLWAEPAGLEAEGFAAPPALPAKKGRPIIAWCAIVFLIGTIFALRYLESWLESRRPQAVQAAPEKSEVSLVLLQMQGRYFVGATSLVNAAGKEFYPQIKQLNKGPIEQRLAFITLAGELAGPEEAQQQLVDLKRALQARNETPSRDEAALKGTLDALYTDYMKGRMDAPSVSAKDREFLRSQLGWFGALALAPEKSPDTAARKEVVRSGVRTFLTIIGALIVGVTMGVLGFVGLVLFLIFLFAGKLKTGIVCGSRHGGVYAETFALYMFVYFGLSLSLSFVPGLEPWKFALAGASALVALLTLAWPVARGIPWAQVREDIGLNLGRTPALEPVLGFAGYAMTLPLLALGILMVFVLLILAGAVHGLGGQTDDFSGQNGVPYHPIVLWLLRSDWTMRLQIFVLACVIAPLVEEIMFRGVLYRHLREASWRLGFGVSVLLSALVVSFIFAVIHPQGLIAVPALMALSFGFSLIREWRGTVIPGIIAHGLNNGLVLALVILAFGD